MPCGSRGQGLCQHIHFATSPDGLVWERVLQDTFQPDMRYYRASFTGTDEARWDTINTLPKADGSGGLWGYWTASPLTGAGAGFGETVDSTLTKWRALPPVLGIGGEDPTSSLLLSHQHCADPGTFHTAPICHLGLLKQVKVSSNGVLQVVWWPKNELLRGERIPILLERSGQPDANKSGLMMLIPLSHPPKEDNFDGPARGQFELREGGAIIEGTIERAGARNLVVNGSNLSVGNLSWLIECRPNTTSPRDGVGIVELEGFAISWVSESQTFELGPQTRLGVWNLTGGDAAPYSTFDRGMFLDINATVTWKLLLRSFPGDSS